MSDNVHPFHPDNQIPGISDEPEKLPDLHIIDAASWAHKPVPSREFLDSGSLIPMRTVTLFSGDGGTGKSLLALQLAAGTSLTGSWIGLTVQNGPVLFLSAEDDASELHIRLNDIADLEGLDLHGLGGLNISIMAGRDAVLGADNGKGLIRETALFRSLDAALAEVRPILVVLDNLADIFGGNEIVKSQARQFMAILRGLAIKHGCALVVLAHPSQSGMASGSGTSGNVAWNNSARSRLYLKRIKSDDGTEEHPERRILETMKANYGPTGGQILLEWRQGVFIPMENTVSGPLDASAKAMKAERVFLDMVRRYQDQKRNISPHKSSTYAPSVFAAHPDNEGVTRREFERAMEALLSQDKIKVVETGSPSRRRSNIIPTGEY